MNKFLVIMSVLLTAHLQANPVETVPEVAHVSPIHLNEIESDLQAHEDSRLDIVLKQFLAKGGTIFRMDGNAKPYPLHPGDMVFPSCSGGNNRSQTLWNILRPYSNKIILMNPHATRYGFDPYNGKVNWHQTSVSKQGEEYKQWAGVDKATKLGYDVFAEYLPDTEVSPEVLNQMSNWYNRTYYHPKVPKGTKRIYITFMKNAHVHLYRLNQTNEDLHNVVVLLFPIDDLIHDPLPEWHTTKSSVKAYTELAKMISRYLDFSALEGK